MPLLVVGSVALDCVETPTAKRDDVLGGSAVFFSYAASFFSPVRMIGAVGEDWPGEHTKLLEKKGIDTSGLQTIPGGKTFRWRGRYLPNMNDRETLEVHLNVLGEFQPQLNGSHRDCRFLFLGNASPAVQLNVLEQAKAAELTVADTMDLWISIANERLHDVLPHLDLFVLNEGEARELAGTHNLVKAGRMLLDKGPRHVAVKLGEFGAMLFSANGSEDPEIFRASAWPLETVADPTGAGDTFLGAMAGFLVASGERSYGTPLLRQAIVQGSMLASFTCEAFSTRRLESLSPSDLAERLRLFREATHW